jgi:predicted nucleic acid-binding protein
VTVRIGLAFGESHLSCCSGPGKIPSGLLRCHYQGAAWERCTEKATQAQSSLDDFEKDLRAGVFQLRPLTEQVLERARQLSRQTTPKLGTRAADLLHVATALELSADYLYSFDQQRRKLARSAGLKVN